MKRRTRGETKKETKKMNSFPRRERERKGRMKLGGWSRAGMRTFLDSGGGMRSWENRLEWKSAAGCSEKRRERNWECAATAKSWERKKKHLHGTESGGDWCFRWGRSASKLGCPWKCDHSVQLKRNKTTSLTSGDRSVVRTRLGWSRRRSLARKSLTRGRVLEE